MRDAAAPLAIEGLLLEILAGAARERDLRLTGGVPRWLIEARDYLHDPGQVGSLGELAAAVGVHPVTLRVASARRTAAASAPTSAGCGWRGRRASWRTPTRRSRRSR